MNASEAQTKQKQIENLTLQQLDIVYSLMRVRDWPDSEISRVYKLSVKDVHKIFDNYPMLREACLRNPPRDVLPKALESELATKMPCKRRSDAKFATPADRQAAYRARLQENRRANLEQLSPTHETDSSGPDVEELPVTLCQDPVTETSPENTDLQYSTCYSSSVEGRDVSESEPLPVTPEDCSEREELRVIGE
jgi:hypothetical protein